MIVSLFVLFLLELQCMYAMPPPSAQTAADTTKSRAASGVVDPVSNLANSYVYLYSGTQGLSSVPHTCIITFTCVP